MSTQNDIYDDGDLTLIVGPEEVRFKVSRVAISLASPVWKAMVSGGFAESGSNEIKLPADQPDAMRIVLLQAYLQFARLPTQVSLKTAAGIAELCEKYDVLSLARDRFVEWVAALRADFFIQPSDELALAEWGRCWIWIGWVLRTYADFSMAILKVVQTVSPVVLATMGDLPPNCSEFLLDSVKQTVQTVLNLAYGIFEDATNLQPGGCQISGTDYVAKLCHSIRLGMVTRFMSNVSFSFATDQKTEALSVTTSITKMMKIFADIRTDSDCDEYVRVGDEWHDDCFQDWFRVHHTLDSFVLNILDKLSKCFPTHF